MEKKIINHFTNQPSISCLFFLLLKLNLMDQEQNSEDYAKWLFSISTEKLVFRYEDELQNEFYDRFIYGIQVPKYLQHIYELMITRSIDFYDVQMYYNAQVLFYVKDNYGQEAYENAQMKVKNNKTSAI